MTKEITLKQQAAADYYLETGNKTEAAIKAGYSKNYARSSSYKLFESERIKAYIDRRLKEIEADRIAGATEVLMHLSSVMRGEHTEEIPILAGDGTQELIDKGVAARERLRAAELLAKRYGLLTEKIQLEKVPQIVDDIK